MPLRDFESPTFRRFNIGFNGCSSQWSNLNWKGRTEGNDGSASSGYTYHEPNWEASSLVLDTLNDFITWMKPFCTRSVMFAHLSYIMLQAWEFPQKWKVDNQYSFGWKFSVYDTTVKTVEEQWSTAFWNYFPHPSHLALVIAGYPCPDFFDCSL